MLKHLAFLILFIPVSCLAQFKITGRVLNQDDSKPLSNANVFLSKASVGDKTSADGTFTLIHAKPGKYELVVSIVGFETYRQIIIVNNNVTLPDIIIAPKVMSLKGVVIKVDPNQERNYEWFKEEFLGKTELASECKIVNPDALNLDYDETSYTLTASSPDFLIIENDALGYRIKYLLTNFTLDNRDPYSKIVHYEGSVLFEKLQGTPQQELKWERNRLQVYEGSLLHFLRSALNDRIDEEGFRVVRLVTVRDPKAQNASKGTDYDSVSFRERNFRWSQIKRKLIDVPLHKKDIITATNQKGIYGLTAGNDALYVAYDKKHHFQIVNSLNYLNGLSNTESTMLNFNKPVVLFDSNGEILNPNDLTFSGVWGRERIAGLLPVDYEPFVKKSSGNYSIRSNTLVSKIDTFSSHHPTEKAYLHFDKPYYAAGDTIYFKGYVTLGERHRLSELSGVLHVDFITMSGKITQSLKLQLTDGVTWGDIALPDSLSQENYRVRAYTQWMRNEGNYFEQVIPVASLQTGKILESSTSHVRQVNNSPDLQFFPEGGGLVTGITSKVAFKAIGTNGLGIDVKGTVLDNENKEISHFASTHLGLGNFYVTPEEGKTYRANLIYADGSTAEMILPAVTSKGIALSVNNDSLPKATVKIKVNKAFYHENKGKNYTLLVYSGGKATSVNLKLDSMVISLEILKRRLSTGIARVTLFSAADEPLAERLFFVQNYDELNVDVSSDKDSYHSRAKTNIFLKVTNRADSAVIGHFSVSVIDESKVKVDENNESTILNSLLLTSDLKGAIEQPNYYFSAINNETLHDLDLVMLTHGFRKFEWKQILSNDSTVIAFQPEKGLEITGFVKSAGGRPLPSASVSLISNESKQFTSTIADDKGFFRFDNLAFEDSTKFILQAAYPNGNKNTELVYNSKENPPPIAPAKLFVPTDSQPNIDYIDNSKKQHEDLARYGLAKGRVLKEVKIRAIKENDDYPSSNLGGSGHADQVWRRKDIRGGGTLADQLNGVLRGVHIVNSVPYSITGPMLVVVDGTRVTNRLSLGNYNLSEVETVEVLMGANASIYGMGGGNGVLVITTRRGTGVEAKDIKSTGILPITVSGFYKVREFYSPKYESNTANNRRDLRTTIYWKPEIVTDENGMASFDYYNADGTGSYRVVVEGIDEKGNLGRKVFRYKVD